MTSVIPVRIGGPPSMWGYAPNDVPDLTARKVSARDAVKRTHQERSRSQNPAPLEDEHLDTINNIAGRGFTLGALLELVCLLIDTKRAIREIQGLEEALVLKAELPPDELGQGEFDFAAWFKPEATQTWEVAYRAFVPLSRQKMSALAEIMSGFKEIFPITMVSHTWGNVFLHTVAACVATVMGQEKFGYFRIVPRLKSFDRVIQLRQELGSSLEQTFWICAISVNQHTVACHSSPWPCNCGMRKVTEGPGSEIGAFDHMMLYLQELRAHDFKQLIALDKQIEFSISLDSDVVGQYLLAFLQRSDLAALNSVNKHEVGRSGSDSLEALISSGGNLLRQGTALLQDESLGFEYNPRTMTLEKVHSGSGLLKLTQRCLRFGDRIKKVNGETDRIKMHELLTRPRLPLEIAFVRQISVITRIWVIAEVVEAYMSEMNQIVVPHFHLLKLGTIAERLIASVDVSAAEASVEADKLHILNKIGDGSESYNSKLKLALREVPMSCYHRLLTFVVIVAIVPMIVLGVPLVIGGSTRGWYAVPAFVIIVLLVAPTYRFWYYWHDVAELLNDRRLHQDMRQEMHMEVEEYFEAQKHSVIDRLHLMTGMFVGSNPIKRFFILLARITAYFVIGWIVMIAALHPGGNVEFIEVNPEVLHPLAFFCPLVEFGRPIALVALRPSLALAQCLYISLSVHLILYRATEEYMLFANNSKASYVMAIIGTLTSSPGMALIFSVPTRISAFLSLICCFFYCLSTDGRRMGFLRRCCILITFGVFVLVFVVVHFIAEIVSCGSEQCFEWCYEDGEARLFMIRIERGED